MVELPERVHKLFYQELLRWGKAKEPFMVLVRTFISKHVPEVAAGETENQNSQREEEHRNKQKNP